MNAKELEAIIDSVLKPFGFIKRGFSWYRHHPETISVLNLQNSDYGGQYYVNLAVALRGLNPGEYPHEERCHIRVRLDRVIDDPETVRKALNLEDRSITNNQRRLYIHDGITRGSQWLEELSTTAAIARKLSSDESLRNRATVQIREFLKFN